MHIRCLRGLREIVQKGSGSLGAQVTLITSFDSYVQRSRPEEVDHFGHARIVDMAMGLTAECVFDSFALFWARETESEMQPDTTDTYQPLR